MVCYSQASCDFDSLSEVSLVGDLHHVSPHALVILSKHGGSVFDLGRAGCGWRVVLGQAVSAGVASKVIVRHRVLSALNAKEPWSQRLPTESLVQHAQPGYCLIRNYKFRFIKCATYIPPPLSQNFRPCLAVPAWFLSSVSSTDLLSLKWEGIGLLKKNKIIKK